MVFCCMYASVPCTSCYRRSCRPDWDRHRISLWVFCQVQSLSVCLSVFLIPCPPSLCVPLFASHPPSPLSLPHSVPELSALWKIICAPSSHEHFSVAHVITFKIKTENKNNNKNNKSTRYPPKPQQQQNYNNNQKQTDNNNNNNKDEERNTTLKKVKNYAHIRRIPKMYNQTFIVKNSFSLTN